jgi:hypothetical protein
MPSQALRLGVIARNRGCAELRRDRRRYFSMSKATTVETEDGRRSAWPLLITIAVGVFGVCSMLIVDHGLLNRLPVPNPKMVHYTTTEDAAKAVGATVTHTTPKPVLEPVPAGPKPVHPAIPDQKKS